MAGKGETLTGKGKRRGAKAGPAGNPETQPLRILIAGSGIAGLTLALRPRPRLSERGWPSRSATRPFPPPAPRMRAPMTSAPMPSRQPVGTCSNRFGIWHAVAREAQPMRDIGDH